MKQNMPVIILILVGSIILGVTLTPVFKSVRLKTKGVSVESTVLSADRNRGKRITYNVSVSFNTPDGKAVTASAIKEYRASAGDKVMIWYDKTNPRRIDFGDSIGYNLRGAFFGALFFFLGVYLLIRGILRDMGSRNLMKSGMKISAEFVSVDRNEKYRMGDKNPWIIKCKWVDNRNNKVYFFVSNDYTIDPVPYLNGRYHVDVFINPADPGKYYMDTSFMPEGNNTIG